VLTLGQVVEVDLVDLIDHLPHQLAGFHVVVDRSAEVLDRGEAGALERAAGEDREPDLDLVEPGGMRRGEVKVHVGVPRQPQIPLGLMSAEVVEDDVDLLVRAPKAGSG
jgi:hypothetical protein